MNSKVLAKNKALYLPCMSKGFFFVNTFVDD